MRGLPARSASPSGELDFSWERGQPLQAYGTVRTPRLVATPAPLRQPLIGESVRVRLAGNRLTIDSHGETGGMPLLHGTTVLRAPVNGKLAPRWICIRAPRVTTQALQAVLVGCPDLGAAYVETPADVHARVSGGVRDWMLHLDADVARARRRSTVPRPACRDDVPLCHAPA